MSIFANNFGYAALISGSVTAADFNVNGVFVDVNNYTRATFTGTVNNYSQGLPITSDGLVCLTNEGTIAYYSNGLPFDVLGRICTTGYNAPSYNANGLSFDINGRLCVEYWSPTRLSNVALWIDANLASTITLNGNTVSQINDRSGNNRNITQPTGGAQPTYLASGAHGRPALSFGAGKVMSTAAGFGSQTQRHVFSVNTYNTTTTDYQYVWATSNLTATSGSGFVPRTPAAGDDWLADDIFAYSNGFGLSQNPRYIATRTQVTDHNLYQVSLGNTESTIRINTVSNATPRVQTLANFPTDSSAFLLSKSTQSLLGEISELVYIDGSLTTTNRELTEGYLAWKWGQQAKLPAGHPYKNNPPL